MKESLKNLKSRNFLLAFLIVGIGCIGISIIYFGRSFEKDKKVSFDTYEVYYGPNIETITQGSVITPAKDSVWETYTNDYYGYSFDHPTNVFAGGQGEFDMNAQYLVVADNQKDFLFVISLDIDQLPDKTSEVFRARQLPLKEYAEKIWKLNKKDSLENKNNIPNYSVGLLEEISVDNHVAYKFNISGAYEHDSGGGILIEPRTLVFTENAKGMKLQISFPQDNEISRKMFESFRILE